MFLFVVSTEVLDLESNALNGRIPSEVELLSNLGECGQGLVVENLFERSTEYGVCDVWRRCDFRCSLSSLRF